MVENGRLIGSGEAVGLDPGVCEVSSRTVSRLRRVSFRARAKSSEATRKSTASESIAASGCSSNESPAAKRCISAIIGASAKRLVEPART